MTRLMPSFSASRAAWMRRRAAEGDHGAVLQLLAALDGMHARGIGHVLLDDLADAECRVEALQAERRADRLVDGGAAPARVESLIVPPAK